MWAKIEIVPAEKEIIYLPRHFENNFPYYTKIEFGGKLVSTLVQYSDKIHLDNSTFDNPGTVIISDKLRDSLLIPESLVYQISLQNSNIVIGPVIGFLLGMDTCHYNPKYMKKYSDRFGIYNKIGGLIYAFSPKLIDWENNSACGLYYNSLKSSWDFGCFPLPDAIYRRNFHSNQRSVRRLIQFTKGKLFNSYRFTKFELYNFIREDSELCKYLPPTEMSINFSQVKRFIDQFSKVILKPIDLSRGRGICIIEKIDNKYTVTDYREKLTKQSVHTVESLFRFFAYNPQLFKKYLIQKYLNLANIDSSLFDIRVVMQKQWDKSWKCSGIECRVSNSKSHLTNISRGGYALPLEEALNKAFETDQDLLANRINELSKKFCLYMDTWKKHFAEFGLDIAVDKDKNIWLIEANVFPSFKGFKKMDYNTYLEIRHNPLLYALSLTKFRKSLSEAEE